MSLKPHCFRKLKAALFLLPVFAGWQAYADQQIYIPVMTVQDNGGQAGCSTAGTDRSVVWGSDNNPWANSALISFDKLGSPTQKTYPAGCLRLCATLRCVNTGTDAATFGVNELRFEMFKFSSSGNPFDPASTPPIRTIYVRNIASCIVGGDHEIGEYCAPWDGSYNVDGEFGKTNGQFGFRAKVTVNFSDTDAGTVNLEQTSAYPGANQYPVRIDVVNIHGVRSTPTVVGTISPVAAQPYNVLYRLSKDAIASIKVSTCNTSGTCNTIRTLVDAVPRIGEGTPNGTLQNGDFWDGRDDQGRLMPAGNYVIDIDAYADDNDGRDAAYTFHRQMSLDPLQITDFRFKALGASATDLATISYTLTESATVYVRIYPPDTLFTDVNVVPPVATGGVQPLREIVEQKEYRRSVMTVWDGRTSTGAFVGDGDYVYAIWAEMPDGAGGRIYTSKTYTGVISVNRGLVITSQIIPSSTVIGSSPSVAGINPFYFRYTLSRDAPADLKIYTSSGQLVRHLVKNEVRSANFTNEEYWDGINDDGYYVSSGTYMLELSVADPLFPSSVNRVTSMFPVDLFRITDVKTAPLTGGASTYASVTYSLSQTFNTDLRIYPPGTIIPTGGAWPPADSSIVNSSGTAVAPIKTFTGTWPGRNKITEYWDGLYWDGNESHMAGDGEYVFMLLATSSSPVVHYNADSSTTVIMNMAPTDRVTGKFTVVRSPVYVRNVNITTTSPPTLSSETVKLPPYSIEFEVTRISSVTVKAINTYWCGNAPYIGSVCRNIVPGTVFEPGVLNKVFWDGRDDNGNYLPADAYVIKIESFNHPDETLYPSTTFQTSLEVDPFQVYDMAVTDVSNSQMQGIISYQVSVPMRVAIQIFKPGTTIDASGNPSPPIASGSLIKVIGGIRPPWTPVEEIWDGSDRTYTQVPDGQYVYRVVTSTDSRVINPDTGEITNSAYVADFGLYLTAQVITVYHGDSADPCGDLNATVSFYPNPLRTAKGTFRITRVPASGNYSLKIYNLAGDLVYSKDIGYLAPTASYPNYELEWAKKNDSGNTVARGVYFAVIELKGTQGRRETCQTVKKILIP